MSKRILFATIGSLGDLHPCIALGLELRRRGYQIVIASTAAYRARVESLGLGFHAIRPDWQPSDGALIAQCEDLKTGPQVLFRKLILPHLEHTYTDLLAAARSTDLMIAGELVFAAPLVAEKLGLPWASAILSPTSFLSAYDPSLLVNAPWLLKLRRAGWHVNKAALEMGMRFTRHWWKPVRDLRQKEGLRPECSPLTRDKFSPHLVLALFSRSFAEPQPDWPESTVQTGFVFYDGQSSGTREEDQLRAFLDEGEPPLVFTLGSTAVNHPGSFYESSMPAVRRLGKRAILLGVPEEIGKATGDILSLPYAPYSQVFPRASVIVHQGGSGTTGRALRAGRPMLIVPYGWDQPDNAVRVERLGAALMVPRAKYAPETSVAALSRLLNEPDFTWNASIIGKKLAKEDGLTRACDAAELLLK